VNTYAIILGGLEIGLGRVAQDEDGKVVVNLNCFFNE